MKPGKVARRIIKNLVDGNCKFPDCEETRGMLVSFEVIDQPDREEFLCIAHMAVMIKAACASYEDHREAGF